MFLRSQAGLAVAVFALSLAAQEKSIPVPPARHPRLYVDEARAAEIRSRLADPVLRPVVEELRDQAKRSRQSEVEWQAIQYLVTHDRDLGRRTIETCLGELKSCELPKAKDGARVTGRMMVTGAIVYDWLYPLLTPAEKQAFIAELIRLAKTLECGYPPIRQGSITGHTSEAFLMRDMLSAGIAIYDEYPEMYRLSAGRFFREHLPARNWLYNGHAYHQGDSYGTYRYSYDTYPLFIFDRLGAGDVYNPEQRWVPYYFLYATRPDGQRLRGGDTFQHSRPYGEPWGEGIGTLLTASYYGDGVLLGQSLRQGGVRGNEVIFQFLWQDTKLRPQGVEGLPLSRYFGPPFGWTIARTGWGKDAVIAEMKVNEYNFTNHQHADAGAFQLYYKGALAIDAGLYSGSDGQYGSAHCRNYAWRTIAHNSLLVYDPAEKFGSEDYGNDGGQRLPGGRREPRTLEVLLDPKNGYRTGEVLSHGFGPSEKDPDFTLLQGDLTPAYGSKVKQVTRSWVFLNLHDERVPAALVIFDRVVSANPAFRKYWLLHTLEEPKVDGASAVVDVTGHDARGRLNLDVLLPRAGNAELNRIGGPGKEFWVFGKNYTNHPDASLLKRGSAELGAWRLELSPRAPAAEDLFLTVMQVTDRVTGERRPVQALTADERTGCILGKRVVLLRKDSRRSGRTVEFSVPGTGTYDFLITDLAPGRWRAHAASGEVRDADVGKDSGCAWFAGPGGSWRLSLQ